MATSVNATFNKTKEQVFNACLSSIAILGYNVINSNKDAGIISLETGMSMKSWAGQSLSCTIISLAENQTQLIISGSMKQHGAQMQVFSWGEAESIAKKVINQVSQTVGEVSSIQTNKKGCFIATAVYGSELSYEVQKFYEIKDKYLNKRGWGRLFIKLYYLFSPTFAEFIKEKTLLKAIVRKHVLNPLLNLWYPKIKS